MEAEGERFEEQEVDRREDRLFAEQWERERERDEARKGKGREDGMEGEWGWEEGKERVCEQEHEFGSDDEEMERLLLDAVVLVERRIAGGGTGMGGDIGGGSGMGTGNGTDVVLRVGDDEGGMDLSMG